MAAHIVHCRTCGKAFDAVESEKDKTWVIPSPMYYYHKTCYENWKSADEHTEEDWMLMIYDLIARDLKGAYNWFKIEAQRKKIINQKKTNRGIYFTLYWYFLIKKNKWNEDYGLGIIPHVYEEAAAYWRDKEEKNAGIMNQIERLAKERMTAVPIKLNRGPGRRKNKIKPPE